MCTVCGCAGTGVQNRPGEDDHTHHDHAHDHKHDHHAHHHAHPYGHGHGHHPGHSHDHHHDHGHDHHHDHGHSYSHDQAGSVTAGAEPHLDCGSGPAGVEVAGLSQRRLIEIETDVLSRNNRIADSVRQQLEAKGVLSLNLVSSPGSGKTTLLVETIRRLGPDGLAVIEGDQQTANDAQRIRETGVPALQVNTGKGCHLDASMIERALPRVMPAELGLLFIENVGNLVCPSGFDLGEDAKVVILSLTEGEDKPLKYPHMFAAASLMLLSKMDLAPHVDVDIEACEAYARQINPDIEIIRLSARSGEGMDRWLQWIAQRREMLRQRALEAARQRLETLEQGEAPGLKVL
ncbi:MULTISPECIES: hydrogenase nickel incorporation protein HypB [Halomonas]|uniref:hydrogenase nickel incorporation protein HypB n=1 Tax=Halomonas TaxID=2745 RepID=UPI001C9409F0|nr:MULTISPECIES: hydrogenase nickel incorporation protein HypB [Halomonas]MBY6209359.1 hydrogenase nickel incorporation protein HypB [Halomonas sp. DP3Y7-2]MBY6229514.1 hydrogenase nickel incorporation protein HypB [Halomonas sp. DP3Y7-1]